MKLNLLACAVILLTGLINTVCGQAVLYDNTDHVWSVPHSGPKNVLWIGTGGLRFEGEEYRFVGAAPINLGGHDNISSISIPFGREASTPAEGSLRITLWDSNDDGFPNVEIAEFGRIDFADIDPTTSFDAATTSADNGRTLPIQRFNTPIGNLEPGGTYFIGYDFDNLPVARHGGIQGLTNSASGANGAGATLGSPENPSFPIANNEWMSIRGVFPHGEHLQMRVESASNPYEVAASTLGKTYFQPFDSMDSNGERGFVPDGWAYYDEIVENSVADPTDDEIIYNTFATHAFPPAGARFRLQNEGPTLFNAGIPGESDRALTIGTHRNSGESTIQFVTELTGGGAQSLQLAFDVEAWESDRSKDDPGEAAFDVVIDVDSGNGFEQLLDLGKVTTGATLVPATGDYVNGNEDAYRVSFESELKDVNIPEGSQIRIRWKADLEAETRGWIYGLDNVSLSLLGDRDSVFGDFDGDGVLSPNDIDLLSGQFGVSPVDERFDINSDGVVDLADHRVWVESEDYASTFIGDTNLDGTVNFSDFLALSAGFGKSGGWAEGDFDGNGEVRFPDFLALSDNFGQSTTAAATVPEPSSVILVLIGLVALRRRRPGCSIC